jgi:putative phage-type endonuclease
MSEPPIEQGTAEWKALRAGKVTASRISDMLTKTKSGWGAGRANYKAQLVAERLTGQSAENGFESAAMKWGRETEAQARAAYSFLTNAELVQVPFVDHPTIAMAGASPDSLVGDDGLLEVKCPNTATHISTLLSGKIDGGYMLQMMWQMACTGRKWCDFISFDPRMPEDMQMWKRRVERCDVTIRDIEHEVAAFLVEVERDVAALIGRYRDGEAPT